MYRVKQILFAYLCITLLLMLAGTISLITRPKVTRDPDTYYQAYWNTAQTFDPAKAYDSQSGDFIGNCIEALYEYDGFDDQTTLIPALAESMPTVYANGKVYTIHLRPFVRYPDAPPFEGRPRYVKAQDFIFEFKRIADFHVASPHFDHIMRDVFLGANDFFDYTRSVDAADVDYDHPFPGVKALDDLTLQITLTKPCPQLIYELAMTPLCPMPREWYMDLTDNNTKPLRLTWRLLGTGPYLLDDFEKERFCKFKVNPMYRGRPDVDGNPDGQGGLNPALSPDEIMPHEVKKIVYQFSREQLPRWYRFTQGLYDRSRIPRDKFGTAIGINGNITPELTDRGVIQHLHPTPTVRFNDFAMDIPWIRDNVHLRRAMSLAIDRQRYVKVFLNGDGIVSNGIIPPCTTMYDPKHIAPYERYDPEEAKQELQLARADYRRQYGGMMPTLTYVTGNTSASARDAAEFFQISWQNIGLDVKLDFVDWGKFTEQVRNRKYQLWLFGWVGDYPDEQTFLSLFYSRNRSPGHNDTCYSNPEYDSLYEKATVMPDSPERRDLYEQMIDIIERDVPVIDFNYDVMRDLGYDYVGRINRKGQFVPDVQDHVWLKAKPAYYRMDSALRDARLNGKVIGTLANLVKEGKWTIHLGGKAYEFGSYDQSNTQAEESDDNTHAGHTDSGANSRGGAGGVH